MPAGIVIESHFGQFVKLSTLYMQEDYDIVMKLSKKDYLFIQTTVTCLAFSH